MTHTSSSCQSERLLTPKTVAAERGRPPSHHAGHLGNANLLGTTSHVGLLTNSMGASHTGHLANFVVALAYSHTKPPPSTAKRMRGPPIAAPPPSS